MKLHPILVAAILGAALALPNASSAQVPPAPPTQDSVVGQATILSGFRGLTVDAHSDPDGSNPSGGAGATSRSTYAVSGHVTCMTVVGNRATVGFAVDSGFSVSPGHVIFVEDNGSPGAGRDLANDVPAAIAPTSCPAPTDEDLVPFPFIPIRPQPIEAGDITVVDAQPSQPTSKEQCKNGGWRDFPEFRNQGQCIAFVEHGTG